MKYFLDTEFYERPNEIDLISLGIVREDGASLYLENAGFDWNFKNLIGHSSDSPHWDTPRWLVEHVKPHLKGGVVPGISYHKQDIKMKILRFINENTPEFWGYYCDYDWVVFCWIFGRMVDLPVSWPMYCRDVKQLIDTHSIPNDILPGDTLRHHALDDAKWTKEAYDSIGEYLEEEKA